MWRPFKPFPGVMVCARGIMLIAFYFAKFWFGDFRVFRMVYRTDVGA